MILRLNRSYIFLVAFGSRGRQRPSESAPLIRRAVVIAPIFDSVSLRFWLVKRSFCLHTRNEVEAALLVLASFRT